MTTDKKIVMITFSFEAGISDEVNAEYDICKFTSILETVTSLTGEEFNWIGKITAKMEEIQ